MEYSHMLLGLTLLAREVGVDEWTNNIGVLLQMSQM